MIWVYRDEGAHLLLRQGIGSYIALEVTAAELSIRERQVIMGGKKTHSGLRTSPDTFVNGTPLVVTYAAMAQPGAYM